MISKEYINIIFDNLTIQPGFIYTKDQLNKFLSQSNYYTKNIDQNIDEQIADQNIDEQIADQNIDEQIADQNIDEQNTHQNANEQNTHQKINEENTDGQIINNETIGIAMEKAWCDVSNIECNHNLKRINTDFVNKFKPYIENFFIKNPYCKAIRHIGNDNKDIDYIIIDNKTLSLKTLKKFDGKICPQNIGQPTYSRFDKIWNLPYDGEYKYNSLRFEFIKKNIKNFLNEMLKNLFCCDYEVIGYNCEKDIKIEVLKKPNMNYFDKVDDSHIIFTRQNYEEKWNEVKNKYSEFSTTIKLKNLTIGELQFHKTSRNVVKFRFDSKFLKY